MTITRLWQAGLESDGTNSHLGEFSSVSSSVNVTTSSTYAKSGTYSLRFPVGNDYATQLIGSSQARTGFHVRGLELITDLLPAYIVAFRTTANLVGIRVKNSTTLALWVGATEQDTYAFATPTSDFNHFGLDVKVDATAGWAVAYIDGVEVMRFEGNTGSDAITSVRYGDAINGFKAYTYCDDLLIDDTTGETAAAPVPDRRFEPLTPNGNGTYSEGTGSDGNSTDNYLLVDDRPHNSDTDYIELDTADERELYTVTTTSPPAGFIFAALIPFAYAKKTDGAVATQLAPLLRLGSVDLEGTAQNLSTSYAMVWERFAAKPGGGAWTQTDIDAVEVGYQGEGTF